MKRMPALSIRQPHAEQILRGKKKVGGGQGKEQRAKSGESKKEKVKRQKGRREGRRARAKA